MFKLLRLFFTKKKPIEKKPIEKKVVSNIEVNEPEEVKSENPIPKQKINHETNPRTIRHIVIHCSATIEGRDFDVFDIDKWHKAKGWKGCGYHYVIKLGGTIQKGRSEIVNGAHVKGSNHNSIGICYIGGLDASTKSKDTRTPNQKQALIFLIQDLKERYPKAVVSGHRDFSPDKNKDGKITKDEWMKDCPCFGAKNEYKT